MGGKKKGKKKGGKKGGANAWMKLIAETTEEAVVKDTIMERITIEKLREGLEELEEENKEIVAEFHEILNENLAKVKMDDARMAEYSKELIKLKDDKDALEEEIKTQNKMIEDLTKSNETELKNLR